MTRFKSAHQLLLVVLVLALLSGAFAKKKRGLSNGLKIDRDGLMALKSSISSPGRSKVNAWKARGNPCFPKPWPHITCDGGRVVAIELANLDIVGTLPTKLKKLNRLVSLDLENNEFSGTIPAKWADSRRFRNLEIINLGNNNLNGDLPNRKWNLRNAFRNLHTLILANNFFSGGLPDGWLSTANTFCKLKFLDLSDNQLGSDDSGNALAPYAPDAESDPTTGWCLPSRTDDSGWCPKTVSKARAFSLEVLDLSENGLTGQLPSQWPQLFPNLQSLLLQRNGFWSGSASSPAALPDSWTRNTVPRAFPQLEVLVLYPGNDNICSIPDGNGGFSDINAAASYVVEDDSDTAYDGENPWFCPGTDTNNPAEEVAVAAGSTNIEISWKVPQGAGAGSVYGYRVALLQYNPDWEEWELVPPFTGQVLPVLGAGLSDTSDPLSVNDEGVYTLDTGIAVPASGSAGLFQARVTTVNLNMEEATPAVGTSVLPALTAPASVTLLSSDTELVVNWPKSDPEDDVGGYRIVIEKKDGDAWQEVDGQTYDQLKGKITWVDGTSQYNSPSLDVGEVGTWRAKVSAFWGTTIPPPPGALSPQAISGEAETTAT